MLVKKSCKTCGSVFTGGPNAKWCESCRNTTPPRRRKIGSLDRCAVCGGWYSVKSGPDKYCGDGCRKKSQNEINSCLYGKNKEAWIERAKLRYHKKIKGDDMKKITYEPTGINNFHNCAPLNLFVKGEPEDNSYEGPIYRISKSQAGKLEKHFCGIKDCQCPKGAVIHLDADETEFGIRVKWCS